jgi:hypothetical protein
MSRDKFTLISWIFDRFIENSQSVHHPGMNVTIDYQLLPNKCRCPFTQYMANKPDKFVIKVWLLCDTDTKYVQNAIPYLGKDDCRPKDRQLGHHVVMQLMKPYFGKGHNVTTDHFFTSLPLIKDLKSKPTSSVGTCRWTRRELPSIIHTLQRIERHDSLLFQEESSSATLTVYKSKPQKTVLIISSQHNSCSVNDEHIKRLPETIVYCNKTKHGVNKLDQMTRQYTTMAKSRRWPVHVFLTCWILLVSIPGLFLHNAVAEKFHVLIIY